MTSSRFPALFGPIANTQRIGVGFKVDHGDRMLHGVLDLLVGDAVLVC